MKNTLILSLLLFKISFGGQVLDVPFVKQMEDLCGPAALSSVFLFYGENIPQEEIAKDIYIKQLKGTLITDMENYAKKKGFKTLLKSSNIEEIKKLIDDGKPVIALIDLGFWTISVPHYVVVLGYNHDGIITHTGLEEKKLIPYREFEKKWQKLGKTLLVVYK